MRVCLCVPTQNDGVLAAQVVAPDLLEVSATATRVPADPVFDALFVGTYIATIEVPGLPASTTFEARVQITTTAAQCVARDDSSPHSLVATVGGSVPGPARNLEAVPVSGAAVLSWNRPADRGGVPPLPYVMCGNGATATPRVTVGLGAVWWQVFCEHP